jgi:hypothetical protein
MPEIERAVRDWEGVKLRRKICKAAVGARATGTGDG